MNSIMSKLTRVIVTLIVAVLVATSSTAFAQTATTQTFLSSAMTATTNTMVVNSATTFAVGAEVYVDKEAMFVTAVNGTTMTVVRGQDSTTAFSHAANAVVWVAVSSATTNVFGYSTPAGSCVRTNMQNAPIINVTTGEVIDCVNGLWASYRFVPVGENLRAWTQVSQANGAVAATSAGYTIRPNDYVVALSTTGTGTGGTSVATNTFTLPNSALYPGRELVIKDESGGLTATTKIIFVGTLDGAGTPNLSLTTAFGGITIYAGSGGWYTVSCWSAGCR